MEKLTGEKAKAQVAPSHAGGRSDQGINAAVRELGIDRTEAQRAVKIANMAPEAKTAAKDVGIDDNQSALLRVASEKTAEDQLAAIRREQEAADRRKQENQKRRKRKKSETESHTHPNVVALAPTESEQFADWLLEKATRREVPMVISWLEACKTKDVVAAMRRRAA